MAPRFQVRADVLVYALLVGGSTAATLAWTNYYGMSEEEKLKILREKYPVQIKKNEDQRQQMQAFFDKMKDGNNSELDGKFNAILKGGKTDMKRQYPPGMSDQTPVVNTGTDAKAAGPAAGSAPKAGSPASKETVTTTPATGGVAPASTTGDPATSWWGWGWW